MLQSIRDRVTGIVAIFVLGLLAVPFLFFGVDSYIQSDPQDAVAVVGDEEITSSEFQTSFARYRAQLRREQGDAYNEVETNQPIARREHLEGMIEQRLLRQYADELGLAVTDAALFRIIREIPGFQVGNEFDRETYRQVLSATGRSPRGFEQELRDDLLVNAVPSSLTSSAIVTEAEVDRMIALREETRSVSLIEVVSDDFAEQIEIEPSEVEAYYEDNIDRYMTTERVQIRYVELDAENLTGSIPALEESELRQRYEAARQRYLTPEARRASHILIQTGEERGQQEALALASELRDRIEAGEEFAALAEEFSDDPVSAEDGGDLGWIEPEQMVAPFEEALYELDGPGALSEPVATEFGVHLIRLDEIRPPEGMTFEQARPEIRAEYVERESEAMFIEMSDRLVDLVFADDTTLEPLALELDLDIKTTEPFARSGGSGIASNPKVVEAAFSDLVLIEGAISDPIELDRNRLAVVKLEEHFPSEPRPLEEVSERIRERLLNEQASELAEARASELAEAAKLEGDLEAVAASAGLELVELDSVARFDFQQGPNFIDTLFKLPAPESEPTLHVVPKGRNFAVIRLESVTPGMPAEATENQRRSARQQIEFMHRGYELNGLIAHLRANTEIRVLDDQL
jgi:peptidyl-prolyl cis-trans isomerase D